MQELKFYFGLGWEHITEWGALDHQLFILALAALYLFKDWKKVAILVTAFTIGHSITLALSVLDIFTLNDKLVEFLIPCTIVITAAANIFIKEDTKAPVQVNYFLALFFGFIHGMGFANAIRFMLVKDESLGIGLFGFNIGLEAGQLLVVAIILLVAELVVNIFHVKRRNWILVISASVISVALMMVYERIKLL
jgi:hypothetical protein